MIIACMEFCWLAMALAATKWQSGWGRTLSLSSAGSIDLRPTVLLGCKKGNDPVAQEDSMKLNGRR